MNSNEPSAENKLSWETREKRFRWDAKDLAPLLTLALLVLFFSFVARGFFSLATVRHILTQGSVRGIVATGLTFVLLCGEIDLAVAFLALWTACLCGWLFESDFAAGADLVANVPAWAILVCIALPMLTTLLMGWLSGALVLVSRLPSFIITLAMMNIAYGLSSWLTQSTHLHVPHVLDILANGGIDLSTTLSLPYSAMITALVMIAAYLTLHHTRFGRHVYMTGGNREAARLAGIRCGSVVTWCLVISAGTAGIGGLLSAGRLGLVSLDQNQNLLLDAVACVVLGGTSLFGGEGGIGKTLVGVLTFTVLNVGLLRVEWINDHARVFLLGVVLMAALVLNGILSKRADK